MNRIIELMITKNQEKKIPFFYKIKKNNSMCTLHTQTSSYLKKK